MLTRSGLVTTPRSRQAKAMVQLQNRVGIQRKNLAVSRQRTVMGSSRVIAVGVVVVVNAVAKRTSLCPSQ